MAMERSEMVTDALSARAREAALAAMASVHPVELEVLSGRAAKRDRVPRPPHVARPALMAVGAVVVVAVGLGALGVTARSDDTKVSTRPADQPTSLLPTTSLAPASPASTPALPTGGSGPDRPGREPLPGAGPEKVVAAGRINDGRTWTLSASGPSDDLCLSVDLTEKTNIRPTVCAGRPPGDSSSADDRYLPLVNDDGRKPPLVFGRLRGDAAEVEVVLSDGRTIGRHRVISGDGGPFFVVELPVAATPAAVIAYQQDGRSERYAILR